MAKVEPDIVQVEDDDEMPQIEAKTEVAEKKPVKIPPASICKLFSKMDTLEVIVLLVGCLGAIGNGLSQPLLCIVFGDLIDGMGSSSGGMATMSPAQMTAMMDGMMSQMEELCITMMLVGVGATFAAFLQGACFKIFAEKQAFKFRVLYFDSVLHQDVGWFDTKEVAALPAEINDDLEKIQDAFGDKFGNGVMAAAAFLGGLRVCFRNGLADCFGDVLYSAIHGCRGRLDGQGRPGDPERVAELVCQSLCCRRGVPPCNENLSS